MIDDRRINELIAASSAEAVAVGHCDLGSGDEFYILPDEVFPSASTMKVCVLMELFHRAALGELSLDDKLTIRNEFPSIADGTAFSVDIEGDGDKSLHTRIGESESLINIAWPMITHSGNLATNLLVERLGAGRITAYMRELKASGLYVLRGVVDSKAFDLGQNNTVTARGLTTVMALLGRREVVSATASDAMLEILLAQTYRESIPAGLPPGTRVANKTGWYDDICHDTAVVFPGTASPYALTVLTRGIANNAGAQRLIADIARLCSPEAPPPR